MSPISPEPRTSPRSMDPWAIALLVALIATCAGLIHINRDLDRAIDTMQKKSQLDGKK